LICETVTLELPVLLSVTVCVLLVPTNTLPKLKLVGLAESCDVTTTPVPLRATVVGELVAVLVMETLPLVLPPIIGENTTVIWALWLGARVCGTVNGAMLNPAPKTPTCEIVTLLLPLLVKVTVCELLLPTFTLPKLRLVGLAESR
jgi:hypothetical protein